ncbi:hypothetical protein SDJN02_16457, partial [Cucurbita argyrosperma subsp. argyrosperma]
MDNYSERNILKLIQSVRRRRFGLKVIPSCYSIIHWSQKEVGRDATIHPNDATVRSVSCEGKKEKEQGRREEKRREEKDRDGISSGQRKTANTAESSFSSLCQGEDSFLRNDLLASVCGKLAEGEAVVKCWSIAPVTWVGQEASQQEESAKGSKLQ